MPFIALATALLLLVTAAKRRWINLASWTPTVATATVPSNHLAKSTTLPTFLTSTQQRLPICKWILAVLSLRLRRLIDHRCSFRRTRHPCSLPLL